MKIPKCHSKFRIKFMKLPKCFRKFRKLPHICGNYDNESARFFRETEFFCEVTWSGLFSGCTSFLNDLRVSAQTAF